MTLRARSAAMVAAALALAGSVLASRPGAEPPSDLPPGANTMCPVMEGETVDPEVFTDYKGKRIYFCCKKCLSRFRSDPEAYVGRLDAPAAPDEAPSGTSTPPAPSPEFNAAGLSPKVNDRLFATNDPAVMAIRRAIRLGLVQAPAGPPEVEGPLAEACRNEVDRFIVAKWTAAGLREAESPPGVCDDATFARRAHLDVIGVIPTIGELRGFLADGRADKRERLVDALLARDQDYADHWTPFWEDALGSTTVNNQGGIPGRGNYRKWINESFRANKAFDVFAAELIDTTMPGAQKPMVADANGRRTRTSYVLNHDQTATVQSAAAVSQVFMGTAMKCASCHNHFENPEWTQRRVFGFASLFSERNLELVRCEVHSGTFAEPAFPFEIPGAPAGAPADEEGRLRRAAQLLTDPTNPRFARAIVNRLWKRYLGLGLFEPADDFRLDVPASHPELLDWLAYDLESHDFDLKRTIRLILTSRTYQLAYDPALEDRFDVAKKTAPRYFRSPSLRRLAAEQVIDSIAVATSQRLDRTRRLFLSSESTALGRALGKPASRNEIATGRSDEAAVVQLLELLNGEEYAGLIGRGRGVFAARPTADAFEAALSRRPTPAEEAAVADYERAAAESSASDPGPTEVVLLDDSTPAGATLAGSWTWRKATEAPVFSGKLSHWQSEAGKQVQHYTLGGMSEPVGPDDVLVTYVHIDPADDPPREIMLQWNDGEWEHRAFWGDDVIPFGKAGTSSRVRMGELPRGGEWVRLEVPGAMVGLGARPIVGLSFDQHGGRVAWDRSTIIHKPASPGERARLDVLWALMTGPEFQYIR